MIKLKQIKNSLLVLILLLCSCGAETAADGSDLVLPDTKAGKFIQALIDLGNNFAKAMASFGEMLGEMVGLGKINNATKKKDVADTITKTQNTLEKTNKELTSLKAPDGATTEAIKTTSEKMTKIAAALKAITTEIGAADDTIAPSAAGDGPLAAAKDKIKGEAKAVAGAIKTIIDLVLPDAKTGTAKSAVVATAKQATAGDAITLFANKGTAGNAVPTAAAGKAAATIVAKATGEGMLKAIADDATTKAVALAGGYAATANDGASKADDDDITAVVGSDGVTELSDDIFAGAVALRAITKTGKFGAKAEAAKATEAIGGAASAAVNKLLGALMYAIKSGVEKDIKKIQESIAKIKSDGSSKKTDIVKEDTKKAEATTAKS
ncbi:variable large family protein [Borrelia turcica]|nr:variable large family protein [Borrelia turcica]